VSRKVLTSNGLQIKGGSASYKYGYRTFERDLQLIRKQVDTFNFSCFHHNHNFSQRTEMDPMKTNAQNTEDGEKLLNSPTLGLKEMAGTIMAELENNEYYVNEVVVHVVVRLPKGGSKNKNGKKNCKARVSTLSYKFDINQAIFHKVLAKRRQQQQQHQRLLLARRSTPFVIMPTGSNGSMEEELQCAGVYPCSSINSIPPKRSFTRRRSPGEDASSSGGASSSSPPVDPHPYYADWSC